MLYYRTHASRTGETPAELLGWKPPVADVQISENVVGEHRVLGLVPPMVFAPPAAGWLPIGQGWEIVLVGGFNPIHLAKRSSTFPVAVVTVGEHTWFFPKVLTDDGERAFKVTYGGPEFMPQLTSEQTLALALASEIRTAHAACTLPEMSVQARWAAGLLPLTYHLSSKTIGAIGIHEDIIAAVLAVAGGYYASPDN